MTDDETVTQFLNVFQGRTDAWGGDDGRAIYGDVTPCLVAKHLFDTQPIGVYPIRHKIVAPDDSYTTLTDQDKMDNMWVRWGCCDIDTGDWSEAYMLANTLKLMGFYPHVERSRSKGWHIWVFTERWCHAYEMRRALKVAYKAIGLPAKEANPKSELLGPNQLGNYVRLPYPHGWETTTKRCMMNGWSESNDGSPQTLNNFLGSPTLYSERDMIRSWAGKWYEPPRKIINVHGTVSTADEAAYGERLQGLHLKGLFENGPHSGDRSQGLAALAHNTAQNGWTPEDVYRVVVSADGRWGKYAETRKHPEDYYRDIVERAFK